MMVAHLAPTLGEAIERIRLARPRIVIDRDLSQAIDTAAERRA
jgi:hypothetical protein